MDAKREKKPFVSVGRGYDIHYDAADYDASVCIGIPDRSRECGRRPCHG